MKIRVKTKFDCTATGVTGNFRPQKLPVRINTGDVLQTREQWERARNQQRNWETLTQVLQLRSQILLEQVPQFNDDGTWEFEFEVERAEVYSKDDDPVGLLKEDCTNVPILTGLGETEKTANKMIGAGKDQNIWITAIR